MTEVEELCDLGRARTARSGRCAARGSDADLEDDGGRTAAPTTRSTPWRKCLRALSSRAQSRVGRLRSSSQQSRSEQSQTATPPDE